MKLKFKVNSKRIRAMIIATVVAFVAVLAPVAVPAKHFSNKQQVISSINHNKQINNKQTYHKSQLKGARYMIAKNKLTVGATAYYGDTITSTGTKPIVGRTIAVDPRIIPYGSKVYIPQLNKVFIAEDCGGAIKGNRIDIFMNSYDECMNWGYKTITIYILND